MMSSIMSGTSVPGTSPNASSGAPSGSSANTVSSNEAVTARRRTLSVVVGCLLREAGCVTVEKAVLGTLVEMLQCTIVEIGRVSQSYCELAYRSEPLVADIILGLADMGINYDGLQAYSRRTGRSIVPPPTVLQDTKHHTILQVGDKKPHLAYIPDNLPAFPDTHTYCFTPTVKQPVTEYEAIREKAATQKRDIERALTKFATKTNVIESVFIAEDKEFALVCIAPNSTQNIDALMPRDQVFEAELDYEVTKARKKRQDRLNNFQQQQLKQEQGESDQELKLSDPMESDATDNPYLRSVKMPKKSAHRAAFRNLVNTPPKESTLGPNINRIVLSGHVDSNKSQSKQIDDIDGLMPSRNDKDIGFSHRHDVLDNPASLRDENVPMADDSYLSLGAGTPLPDDEDDELHYGDEMAPHTPASKYENLSNNNEIEEGTAIGMNETEINMSALSTDLPPANLLHHEDRDSFNYYKDTDNGGDLSSFMEDDSEVISPEARERMHNFNATHLN